MGKCNREKSQLHPENPQILEILIWLTPRFAIRQFAICRSVISDNS
ncbi:MAG: hypothetical protein HCA25_08185 [Dolichospermum sp. DET50]|nr:hypothetical protein [Dolichospermum sp. DET66]MBS3032259.1 hypothetical protein [Dolichospermum sp. DET67]MBS3037463.1 hypothetical protein [Dolichospermum sp. DET50]QSX69436.1 MAG: hypothetical protein EZY12_07410 [Dolichospermum sp. DET69]